LKEENFVIPTLMFTIPVIFSFPQLIIRRFTTLVDQAAHGIRILFLKVKQSIMAPALLLVDGADKSPLPFLR
jgi:hypothetical protein